MMSVADTVNDSAGMNNNNNSDNNNNNNNSNSNNHYPEQNEHGIRMTGPPPRAVILQHVAVDAKLYWDRSHYASPADQMKALEQTCTVYVGNLPFTIKSHHVHHHFTTLLSSSSSNGTSSFTIVKRVILGIDKNRKTPCGFCFVELYHRRDALRAVSMISGTQLDGKVIRVELDAGFQNGRQFGRGKSGGQVRDDKRLLQQQRNENMKRYRDSGEDRGSSVVTQPLTERPVRLDEALPSTRNQGHGPVHSNNNNDNDNAQMENANDDDFAPSAKRIKRE